MSAWYSLEGQLTVRSTPSVMRLVEEFNKVGGGITAYVEKDEAGDTATVEFSGGEYFTATGIQTIDQKARDFGPHVLAPTRLAYDYEGEPGQLRIDGDEDGPREAALRLAE
jgi:hypothetical protein